MWALTFPSGMWLAISALCAAILAPPPGCPQSGSVYPNTLWCSDSFFSTFGENIWCFVLIFGRNCCQKHWCHSRPHHPSWTSSAADNVQIFKMFFMRNWYFLSQLKPRLLFNKIIFKLSRSLFEFKFAPSLWVTLQSGAMWPWAG